MDFDHNARNDIVLVTKDENNKTSLASFYNNYNEDSYYVSASIHTTSSSAYGQKVYGVNCRAIYTSLSDDGHTFTSQQLTRSSYGALEEGIAVYEIGRSNNFVEDFTVTYQDQKINSAEVPYCLSVRSRSWTPIIPNSQLIIDIHKLDDWEITLLVNPNEKFLLVGVVITLLLIGTGAVIIWMRIKEKREDEKERNPLLNFI